MTTNTSSRRRSPDKKVWRTDQSTLTYLQTAFPQLLIEDQSGLLTFQPRKPHLSQWYPDNSHDSLSNPCNLLLSVRQNIAELSNDHRGE